MAAAKTVKQLSDEFDALMVRSKDLKDRIVTLGKAGDTVGVKVFTRQLAALNAEIEKNTQAQWRRINKGLVLPKNLQSYLSDNFAEIRKLFPAEE